MATYLQRERRRRIAAWIAVIVLTCAALALSYWLIGPPPPETIRMATGEPGGAYAAFGKEYARILGNNGLRVDLVSTPGGMDNFHRLVSGEVDVAFVQGGTYPHVRDPDRVVRGIAAVYREPLWVIYRPQGEVSEVTDFRGQTIAIGPPESGTETVARVILEVNGITEENSVLRSLSMAEAGAKLTEGTVDAAFMVSSLKSPLVNKLLRNEALRLMSFRRHRAYARIFPYLTPVELAEGVLDLEQNVPPERTSLLAPSALLACRRDLHPRVVEQLLSAARRLHSQGGLIDQPDQFPSLESLDLPVHETAEAYLQTGESLISRLVPYWAMQWVVKGQFLIIPALTLWIPFFKLLPLLYQYRVASLLRKHYAALRDIENRIDRAGSPQELKEPMQELQSLRDDMERLSRKIPAYYQRDVYHWRLHVAMVQEEARHRVAEAGPGSGESGSEEPEKRV